MTGRDIRDNTLGGPAAQNAAAASHTSELTHGRFCFRVSTGGPRWAPQVSSASSGWPGAGKTKGSRGLSLSLHISGLTVNKYMNWNSHVQKIANKILCTLGVMNRLKRYLPISAMKMMCDSLILSHLQFGITNWGFKWDCISKLQKRTLRIMTNSRYNAHTEPLLKQLHLLNVKDIFDIQCMKFWYKFVKIFDRQN